MEVIGNSKGEGGSVRLNYLDTTYENKLEFSGGRGGGAVQIKKPSMEGVWMFSGTAQFKTRSTIVWSFIGMFTLESVHLKK